MDLFQDRPASDNETLRLPPPAMQRFWAKVRRTETCWLWMGSVSGGGGLKHGQVLIRPLFRTPQKAHRIAWMLARGPIPAGMQVNHHCDVPTCVNPEHLYLGTQLDNMRDAVARQRFPKARKPRKLPDESVQAIRSLYAAGVSQTVIARSFDVTLSCINQIVHNRHRLYSRRGERVA